MLYAECKQYLIAKLREAGADLLPIEEHCARLGIGKPVLAGACAANGWKPGRVMAEEEFCLTVKERDGFRQAVSPCMIVIRCR